MIFEKTLPISEKSGDIGAIGARSELLSTSARLGFALGNVRSSPTPAP